MLLNDFYRIEEWQGARAILTINADHPIFAGHFPGQPVVPGACQLQIVQELLSQLLDSDYSLVKADQVKFLLPIDPRQYPRIEATLKYPEVVNPANGLRPTATPDNALQVTASLSAGEIIFLKFTGIFRAG
jgi:3-hydroxyacyl-[acyl-carrier-protein] dehydratase